MKASKLEDDCFLHDKDRLKHHEVLALLQERLAPIVATETILLAQAANRVCAVDITAPRDAPAYDNSAVDGFTVRFADLNPDNNTQLPVTLTLQAGAMKSRAELGIGTAARIFTGAIMPIWADTVFMQEDCAFDAEAQTVVLPKGIKPGANCRKAGEDTKSGEVLIRHDQLIRPSDIARLASAGLGEVEVFKTLKVTILSTGDELHEPSENLPIGGVFDANGPMLESLSNTLPVEVVNLGIIRDDYAALKAALLKASKDSDVIITSGGASKGDADFLREALLELGHCHLWQLAIKPGRPMMMGQIDHTPVFGLPGNPVAVFVCWCLYVYPSLFRLAGAAWRKPTHYTLPAGFEIARKKQDRREFYRGWVEQTEKGTVAQKFMRDGSGLISGIQVATGLIEIPEDTSSITKSDLVSFIPLAQFGIQD